MNNKRFSYADFEEAYYHCHWRLCQEIGSYLLGFLKDKRAKKLRKSLIKEPWAWDWPQKKQDWFTKVLDDTKIWLMVNQNNL